MKYLLLSLSSHGFIMKEYIIKCGNSDDIIMCPLRAKNNKCTFSEKSNRNVFS